jgi:hypothetical protein
MGSSHVTGDWRYVKDSQKIKKSAVEENQAALSNAMKFTSYGGKVKIKAHK